MSPSKRLRIAQPRERHISVSMERRHNAAPLSIANPATAPFAVVDQAMQAMAVAIRRVASNGSKVIFVSGNFNIVHPGHVRLLNFAASCGDYLVVGVHADDCAGVTLPEALRLEGVKSICGVSFALILREAPEAFVARLKPDVVVKGKEREAEHNPEAPVVASYGGKLIFSSGETRFSLLELLQKEAQVNVSTLTKPLEFIGRHGLSLAELARSVRDFRSLKVVVVGDLIIDEYITCEPVGMSQEDPTIVVTPIKSDRFIGGAGIVAAHARGLGARVSFFGVTGADDAARYALDKLDDYAVTASCVQDESRPTSLNQRFRASGKTLLRVSHLREHAISAQLCDELFRHMMPALREADLLVFADFNCGCLPQSLVERIAAQCTTQKTMMVADSQSSSQVGDISRFKGMRLVTLTEREARLALRDFSSGLVVLARALQKRALVRDVFVKLGSEGMLIQSGIAEHETATDQLPSFNSAPKDVSGAGDSMLITSSMALAVGADIWQSAYLGSLAAACQVGKIGNLPLSESELVQELHA